MPRHFIPFEYTASRVGDTARHPLCILFPTRKRQDCRHSRDSLGTVLSEAVVAVSFSAPPTVVCSEQLAHSRTAERSRIRDIHLFPNNNPSLDTNQYSSLPLAPRWNVRKTLPPTELQISTTVTTLVAPTTLSV